MKRLLSLLLCTVLLIGCQPASSSVPEVSSVPESSAPESKYAVGHALQKAGITIDTSALEFVTFAYTSKEFYSGEYYFRDTVIPNEYPDFTFEGWLTEINTTWMQNLEWEPVSKDPDEPGFQPEAMSASPTLVLLQAYAKADLDAGKTIRVQNIELTADNARSSEYFLAETADYLIFDWMALCVAGDYEAYLSKVTEDFNMVSDSFYPEKLDRQSYLSDCTARRKNAAKALIFTQE